MADASTAALLHQKVGEKFSVSSVSLAMLAAQSGTPLFKDLIAELSLIPKVYVYLEAENKKTIATSLRESGRQKVFVTNERNETKIVSKGSTAKVCVATILALRCCKEQAYDLFAKIVVVNPLVVAEINSIPFRANIFTPEILLSLFRAMAPKSGEPIEISERLRRQAIAMEQALTHYYSYPPLEGLQQQLPKLTTWMRGPGKDADLLVQDPSLYLREVLFLLETVLMLSPVSEHRAQTVAMENQAGEANSQDIESVAWQAATLIGVSFSYARQYARGLQKNMEKAERLIQGASEVLFAAMKSVGSSVPAAGQVTEPAGVLVGKLTDALAEWAVRPHENLDLYRLASDLAYLSDGIKERSRRGFLVYQAEEVDSEEFRRLHADTRSARVKIGNLFYHSYSTYLAHFKRHYLERSLAESFNA